MKVNDFLYQQSIDTRFEKLPRYKKDAAKQSILNGGRLLDTDEIYYPAKFTKGEGFKDIYVTMDNLKEATQILEDYYQKHGVFAMTHDFENFPDYNFPKKFIDKYARKYGYDLDDNLGLAQRYFGPNIKSTDLKFNPLLVDKSKRLALNEVMKRIVQTEHLDLDKHKINIDYEVDDYDLITLNLNLALVATVALVLEKEVNADLKQIIIYLLRDQKLNLLDENWGENWLAKHEDDVLAKFGALDTDSRFAFLELAGLAKDTDETDIIQRLKNNPTDTPGNTISWALKKARINEFLEKYNKLHQEALAPWFDAKGKVSSLDNRQKIMQALLNEKVSFSRFVTTALDQYFYPFFSDTYTIDGYNFIFLENQIVNAGGSKAKSFVGKADGWLAWWYWKQNLVINAEKCTVTGINIKGYDNELDKRLLTFNSPYKYTYRAITSKNPEMKTPQRGGRDVFEYKYNGRDIANYLKRYNDQINDGAGFIGLDLTYLQTAKDGQYIKPCLNFNEQQLIDAIKESKPGSANEDDGIGLKTFQSNMGMAIREGTTVYKTADGSFKESKALAFNAKDIADITDENLHAMIQYNKNDTISTVSYAIQYKSQQQKAKNAVINLGGQGADLFALKDRGVLLLLESVLNLSDWTFAKREENAIYKTVMEPILRSLVEKQFTLLELAPLGLTTFFSKYLSWKEATDEKQKSQALAWLELNFKPALLGLIYRLVYWTTKGPDSAIGSAYPEFGTVNPTHRYRDTFVFDIKRPAFSVQEKERLFTELTKNDPVYFTASTGLVLKNARFAVFLKQLLKATGGLSPDDQNTLKQVWDTYTKYQKSDVALNQEFTKLRQVALYESTTVGQLIQIAADNKIPLSALNPRWDPHFKLNTKDGTNKAYAEDINDLDNPFYQRVKYLYEFSSMNKAKLVTLETDESKKPYRDLNQDNFLYFKFQTPVLFDLADADDLEIAHAGQYFNNRVIYHSKAPEFMDKERSRAAAHFNKTKQNYPSFSAIWYKDFQANGLTLTKDGQVYHVPKDAFLDPNNWTSEKREEFLDGHALNKQSYGVLMFHYEDAVWQLNGLSLMWTKTDKGLVFAEKLQSITPYEIKYTQKSFDSYNIGDDKVRFETGISIIDEFGEEYKFRLDNVSPEKLNGQAELFSKEPGDKVDSMLFAIDPTNNFDLDNSLHVWNWKKGGHPDLMEEVAVWAGEHPEFRMDRGKTVWNNKFYVPLKNTNNEKIKWKNEQERLEFDACETLVTMIAGGIHGDRQIWFDDSDPNILCVDADQTSFYPWILLSFIQAISTFNPLWYKDAYELNIALKRIGDLITRLGLKLDVNGITGKIGELASILASIPLSTHLLRTGQLQNLQMHTVLRKLMQEAGEPFVTVNVNTDGNEYKVTKAGAQLLKDFCDGLFMRRFSQEAIEEFQAKYPQLHLEKIIDVNLMRAWAEAVEVVPYHELWRNTVEVARAMNMYWQTTVNTYFGFITELGNDLVKDKKKNPALYRIYEKYCDVAADDDCDLVRRKVVKFYKTHRNNLPDDFDLSVIYKNFVTKGFLHNWVTIMELEQAKKDGKVLNNQQYEKFGTGPIIDFATIERIAFDVPVLDSLKRYKNLMYFAFNAKRTESYDESVFVNLLGEQSVLDKNTRYLVCKTKDKALVGNVNKVKHYQNEAFDEGGMLDFFAANKVPYNNQQSIQKFAWELNQMSTAMGLPEFCQLTRVGVVDNDKEVYYIDFDFAAFSQAWATWDINRRGLKYLSPNKNKEEMIWTKKRLQERLYALADLDADAEFSELKHVFSTVLTKNGEEYNVRVKKDMVSKFPGSVVVSSQPDKNGYYTGNFLINESLDELRLADDGEILKLDLASGQFKPTGVFIDYDFYENSVLYAMYNVQKPFVKKQTQEKVWFMQPEELKKLWQQNDIDPRWNKTEDKVKAYCAEHGVELDETSNKAYLSDFELELDEPDEIEAAVEKISQTKKAKNDTKSDETTKAQVASFKKLLFGAK